MLGLHVVWTDALRSASVNPALSPMFVTIQYALHGAGKGLAVLPPDLYSHQCFKHIQGSSWHGSDGRAITWVSHHITLFAGELDHHVGRPPHYLVCAPQMPGPSPGWGAMDGEKRAGLMKGAWTDLKIILSRLIL
eukprot:scaffold12306_cov21-Tisochrysis_lutea.AAC.1